MEYLKIAQDLEMYGINYFFIRVSVAPAWFAGGLIFAVAWVGVGG